jgi:hypothetical protein
VPAPGDYDDGEIGGMMIGKGKGNIHLGKMPTYMRYKKLGAVS